MNFGEIAGEICKKIFPIPEERFVGAGSGIAICTLSSIDLLKEISHSNVMQKIAIAARLFSENRGIDELVRFVNQNPSLHTILVCGKEVSGHKTGHALFCLHKFGTDDSNRIINSISPDPILTVSKDEIVNFQKIQLIDKIGETRLQNIIPIIQ
ncbi:MAG: tetrahydromethanopterin S-methyltransferase subunit A [Nitrososphaeria archaeon]|nr:tetrahydromethanopterin S-methyltransferase subunit A [Nitrososphaeria archaeon]NDF24389.1 tetrahydromethanopterin S-methyltransferase subunit A [Nitrososphaerota archaeon]NDF26269.1 tetrahydromethanopterin S-methyltransferase subunit A [Nitrosopumilaceae archaeon]